MNKEKKKYLKKLEEKLSQQKGKLNLRLKNNDFEGAITASKTFLEGVFEDIHLILLGQEIDSRHNDLRDKFKAIKKLLKLDPFQQSDEKIKSICGSLSSIISNIEDISNTHGDRHFTEITTKKYLASFIVKISLNLAEFLYQRLKFLYKEYHPQKINIIYESLVKILDSSKRLLTKDFLLRDKEINFLLSNFEKDPYAISILINQFISDFEIENYRKNDIFFAAMRIFSEYLRSDQVKAIFLKHKDNDQTWPPYGHLVNFLEEIKKAKPDFINEEIEQFIKDKKYE